jgi:hypothetical protein
MRQTFLELVMYLRDNVDSFYYDDTLDEDSLAAEVMAFADAFEAQIQ